MIAPGPGFPPRPEELLEAALLVEQSPEEFREALSRPFLSEQRLVYRGLNGYVPG